MLNLVQFRIALVAAITLGCAACAAGPVGAQQVQGSEHQGKRADAGYSTTDALTGAWQTVEIFAFPNPDLRLPTGRPTIQYVARRSSGEAGQAGTTTWTRSSDCPALYNTLVWMTVLVAPRIEIAGVSPNEAEPAGRRPVTVSTDGLTTTVWGRGTQPDHTANTRLEMSSNGGLIADFGRAATDNLSQCWRSEEPAV